MPATTPARLRFVAESPVPGLAVTVRRVSKSRACVICVHGALDRGGSFSRLVRALDGFDAVIYDRRGYQGSRALRPVDLDAHIGDLLALADREAARQPVILFGHSFGGVITFAAALRRPESIRLVVSYEAPLPWVLPRPYLRQVLDDDPGVEAELFFRRVMSDAAWERLSESQRESRRLDGPALLADLEVVRRPTAPFDLTDLSTPTTFAYGGGDAAWLDYYRDLGVALAHVNAAIETAEIASATHSAHLSNADQLAELIERRYVATCASA